MTENSDTLQARADRLAKPVEKKEDANELLNLLEFKISDETYGIEVQFTKEIAPLPEVIHLPETPEFILGVMNIRQRVVSIVDLKKILTIPEKKTEARPHVIVIENKGLEFALLVDEVLGLKIIQKSAIQPPPSTFTGLKKDILKGITSEKLILLNGETFFQKNEFIIHKEVEPEKRQKL